jgi:hypothetical protein
VTVTVTRRKGRDPIDSELPVKSLEELFEICRRVGPSENVRVSLKGEDGEVRLSFASFLRTPAQIKL